MILPLRRRNFCHRAMVPRSNIMSPSTSTLEKGILFVINELISVRQLYTGCNKGCCQCAITHNLPRWRESRNGYFAFGGKVEMALLLLGGREAPARQNTAHVEPLCSAPLRKTQPLWRGYSGDWRRVYIRIYGTIILRDSLSPYFRGIILIYHCTLAILRYCTILMYLSRLREK